ncbi:hypothetical protein Tco_1214036 [Tanacetum coccineum]
MSRPFSNEFVGNKSLSLKVLAKACKVSTVLMKNKKAFCEVTAWQVNGSIVQKVNNCSKIKTSERFSTDRIEGKDRKNRLKD